MSEQCSVVELQSNLLPAPASVCYLWEVAMLLGGAHRLEQTGPVMGGEGCNLVKWKTPQLWLITVVIRRHT